MLRRLSGGGGRLAQGRRRRWRRWRRVQGRPLHGRRGRRRRPGLAGFWGPGPGGRFRRGSSGGPGLRCGRRGRSVDSRRRIREVSAAAVIKKVRSLAVGAKGLVDPQDVGPDEDAKFPPATLAVMQEAAFLPLNARWCAHAKHAGPACALSEFLQSMIGRTAATDRSNPSGGLSPGTESAGSRARRPEWPL